MVRLGLRRMVPFGKRLKQFAYGNGHFSGSFSTALMLYSMNRSCPLDLFLYKPTIAVPNTTTSFLRRLWHCSRIKDNMKTLILAVRVGRFWLALSQHAILFVMSAD